MPVAVLFDVDGTLIDSVELHASAWQEALAHFGKDVPLQQIRHEIGKGGDQLLPMFLSRAEQERFGKPLEEFRGRLYKQKYLPQARAFPKVRELFEALLARGARIGLASSAKGDELEHYERLARIEDLVQAETASNDVARTKPHPDVFQAALDRLGAGHAHVVGDSPWDALGARKAGCTPIGLLCGGFPGEELLAAGCVAVFRDPAELLEKLAQSPLA